MLTLVLYALLAIAVAAAVFFVVASLLPAGEQIAPSIRDDRPWELPADQTIRAEAVASVRLPVALRGYRFAETDVLLDRLAEELRARDELIAELQGSAAPSHSSSARAAGPTVDADAAAADESADANESADVEDDAEPYAG